MLREEAGPELPKPRGLLSYQCAREEDPATNSNEPATQEGSGYDSKASLCRAHLPKLLSLNATDLLYSMVLHFVWCSRKSQMLPVALLHEPTDQCAVKKAGERGAQCVTRQCCGLSFRNARKLHLRGGQTSSWAWQAWSHTAFVVVWM